MQELTDAAPPALGDARVPEPPTTDGLAWSPTGKRVPASPAEAGRVGTKPVAPDGPATSDFAPRGASPSGLRRGDPPSGTTGTPVAWGEGWSATRTRVPSAPARLIPGAEPFSLPGGSVGCLLVHGFTSTPYDLRACAAFLSSRGIAAEGVLLAGHGTSPRDLATTRLPDWLNSIREGHARLAAHVDTVYALGISLAGNFLVTLAQELAFDGLVIVGMPLHVRHARALKLLYYTYRMIGKRYQRKWYQQSLDPTIRRTRPNYNTIPLACLRDVAMAIELSRRALPAVRCPVLAVQSSTDHVLHAQTLTELRARLGSRDVEFHWVPDRYHVVLIDHGKEAVFERIRQFIDTQERRAGHQASP